MLIEKGNILSLENLKRLDAICFTSNGVVKNNYELVMGAGVAKAFKNKDNRLALCAGVAVKSHGNRCQIVSEILQNEPMYVIAFPTKHNWIYLSIHHFCSLGCLILLDCVFDTYTYNPCYKKYF